MTDTRNRISIAILALGGQGGGVLAEWVQAVARAHGWLAQGTSVPGVAQRTGSTVYYVELARPGSDGRLPVMAQMPMPGDVDIVIASELMETGRALLRGFATADRTTLIGSTHRIYAISEKSAMGDGRGSSDRIIEAAGERSKRFIGFDMEAAADRSKSVISAIMFGALAGSEALPFPRASFEQAIRDSGIAVTNNLNGFEAGHAAAQGVVSLPREAEHAIPQASTAAGRQLEARARALMPAEALPDCLRGIARLMDYQDAGYASLYLDRLEPLVALDRAPHRLSADAARHLALWMSYDDVIRVADLKIRASRMAGVRSEVRATDDQLLNVTEYMHPRLRELGEALPAPLGRLLLGESLIARLAAPFFRKGRHVRTTSIRWFLMLRLVAALRPLRRSSLRFAEEQHRIGDWLNMALHVAKDDLDLAIAWIGCQRLLKGYGDTFDRGLANFQRVHAALEAMSPAQCSAAWLSGAIDAALADEKGAALSAYLDTSSVDSSSQQAADAH